MNRWVVISVAGLSAIARNSREATGKEVIQEVCQDHETHSNHVVVTTAEFQKVFQEDRGTGF